MGPLGWPEMVFIFFLALILFGPKKMPELGRTVGKALTEFRRASNERVIVVERRVRHAAAEASRSIIKGRNKVVNELIVEFEPVLCRGEIGHWHNTDRKSTRLNS